MDQRVLCWFGPVKIMDEQRMANKAVKWTDEESGCVVDVELDGLTVYR